MRVAVDDTNRVYLEEGPVPNLTIRDRDGYLSRQGLLAPLAAAALAHPRLDICVSTTQGWKCHVEVTDFDLPLAFRVQRRRFVGSAGFARVMEELGLVGSSPAQSIW